jgi:caffeoyl-CoA O-methyltransferase
MEFIDESLDKYVCNHTSLENELLARLNRETNLKVLQPRMLSGHFQGRLLSMISHMINPSYVLELGTFTGYSALCLAEGLKVGGKLITIDINPELEQFVKKYVNESRFKDAIEIHIGDATELIVKFKYPFDLIFIDADKENYLNYYLILFNQLRKGGFMLVDNVLWSGKVVNKVVAKDETTRLINEFNYFVQHDNRVENIVLPLRDGLMLIRKL